ncbi:MAG: hypothetical protein CVV41_15440 [Candidatus Riflebacteria bacterium HGW-Riflebacteria-1]|jgi:hypothetical protein|nr:MAG: hypothetical protein CVV41_15440 [Candidatus Riflebacteria bacterium HGW-Riflebacteria-1]
MNGEVPPLFSGKTDWLIMIGLLLVSLVAWAGHNYMQPAGFSGACTVRIFTEPPQKLVFTGPQPQPLTVVGKTGAATIEWGTDGRIRIASSTCPCKTCVNMGWTDSSSLVCVPNGIIVEPAADTGSKVDAVTR